VLCLALGAAGIALRHGWLSTLTPLELDCATGRIAAGTPLAQVLAAHPDPERTDHGRYTVLAYRVSKYAGTSVVAKDGVVRDAGSWECTGDHLWIRSLTAAENAELERLARARFDTQRARWKARDALTNGRKALRLPPAAAALRCAADRPSSPGAAAGTPGPRPPRP
jgi:hypothetical protein